MPRPRPLAQRRKRPSSLVLMAAIVVALAAVFAGMLLAGRPSGGTQAQPSISASTGCVALSPGTGPCEGLRAPDFTAVTVDGRTFSLSSLRGKVVILWFMAAWCPSCAGVASVLQQASSKDPRIAVVVVDMWSEEVLRQYGVAGNPAAPPAEGPEQLSSFLRAYGSPAWMAVVDSFNLTTLYQLRYVDTTFVIDAKGIIALRNDGPISPTVLLPALAKALASSP
jgi:thiol-disulfide isomerase/thioredoxin